ncbi:hypothetical protein ACC817_28700 [Rhizobium ruizarguesonis]
MTALSPTFERYRRQRKRELMELGLDARQAYLSSKNEALNRQALVPVIGKSAALTAKTLTKLRLDGTFSQFLVVPEREIPSDLRDRAEAWAGAPDRSQAGSPAN